MLFNGLFDDSAIKLAEQQSRIAAKHIGELRNKVSIAKKAADLGKDKANIQQLRKELGVNVKNFNEVRSKLGEWQKELNAWEHYDTNPELIDQINRELGGVEAPKPAAKPEPVKQETPKQPKPANPEATEQPKAEQPKAEVKAETQPELPNTEETNTQEAEKVSEIQRDKLNSPEEITDEDFQHPHRDIELPPVALKLLELIGKKAKPVLLKKEIQEKNLSHHKEITPDISRKILQRALYSGDFIARNQPVSRPNYWVAVKLDGQDNAIVVLDMEETKEAHEIVGWRKVDDRGLSKMEKQAVREGGQFLMTKDLVESQGRRDRLSALPNGSEDTIASKKEIANQEQKDKSGVSKQTTTGESVTTERIMPVLTAPGSRVSLVAASPDGEGIVIRHTRPGLVSFFIPQKLLKGRNSVFGTSVEQESLLGRREAPVKRRDRFSRFLVTQEDTEALRRAVELIERNYGLALDPKMDAAAAENVQKAMPAETVQETKAQEKAAPTEAEEDAWLELLDRLPRHEDINTLAEGDYVAFNTPNGKSSSGFVTGIGQKNITVKRWNNSSRQWDTMTVSKEDYRQHTSSSELVENFRGQANLAEKIGFHFPEEIQSAIAEKTTDENQDTPNPHSDSGEYNSESGTVFSYVPKGELLNRLETEPTVKVFRVMQVIDGKLYPPMAGKVGGKWQEPVRLGQWMQADERPELVKDGKFKLDKGNGSSIQAAYNPYFHTSRSPLNDQFSSAYKRANLVTVECEVPQSELSSGYKAESAKDTVGEMAWHSGPVSSQLASLGQPRQVILSRYVKVNRIVPDSEVASIVAKQLKGTNIAVPEEVVTPSLRNELEKQGVAVALRPETVNQRFNEELKQYDKLDIGHIFKLGFPGRLLQDYGIPNEPIELSKRVIEHKSQDPAHPYSPQELQGLPNAIQKPLAIFKYIDPDKYNLIIDLTTDDKNFLVGIQINSTYRGVSVNNIRGLFPKDTAGWLHWIEEDKALYLDKNKVQEVIAQSGTNLLKVGYLDLDSVNKIVQNFDNASHKVKKTEFSYTPRQWKEMDKAYLDAIQRGDMETAKRMVREREAEMGYSNDESWKMDHRAPSKNGGDVSLVDLKDSGLVPADYWDHPEWYTSSPEEHESFHIIKNALELAERRKAEGNDRPVGIRMYRAVDKTKNRLEGNFRNGDWVTPSRAYAENEGLDNPNGHRIISQYCLLRNLYWDGNSIAELGYDDGNDYSYKDTANNRKLRDVVTYDDDGNVIPLSKRFNKRDADLSGADAVRFDLAEPDERAARLEQAEREYAEVVAKYRGTPQWMKAPNGGDTLLSERQWVQTRTPSFKAWFRDWENDPGNASKVLDANGEPRVVYHGSKWNPLAEAPGKAVFSQGKVRNTSEGVGFYFTADKSMADSYGTAGEYFLSLQNPVDPFGKLDLLSEDEFYDISEREDLDENEIDEAIKEARNEKVRAKMRNIIATLQAKGYQFYTEIERDFIATLNGNSTVESVLDTAQEAIGFVIDENVDNEKFTNDFRRAEIEEFGIDGYVSRNYGDGAGAFVAFLPNQVKSATDNVGTYSGSEADVRFSYTRHSQVNPIREDGMTQREYEAFAKSKLFRSKTRKVLQTQAETHIERMGGYRSALSSVLSGDYKFNSDIGHMVGQILLNSPEYKELSAEKRAKVAAIYMESGKEAGRALAARRLVNLDVEDIGSIRAAITAWVTHTQAKNPKLDVIQQLRDKVGIDPTMIPEEYAEDPAKLDRLLRDYSAAMANKWDKMYEWWVNSILSAPTTHMANTIGNAGNMLYELGIKRFVEASVNLIVRNPQGATFGEMKHMWKALNWKQAWQAAKIAFDREVLTENGKFNENDLRGPAIEGMKGRIIRMPGRYLRAADQLIKALVRPIEATAMAYREGTHNGLRGKELNDYIQHQLEDLNSTANEFGRQRALELTFNEEPGAAVNAIIQMRLRGQSPFFVLRGQSPFSVVCPVIVCAHRWKAASENKHLVTCRRTSASSP
ncbi:MAG: hypothetical protein II943_05320 [Victivallales bacterium]|nr:hypothetical protein [Victivallales bacterium]